MTRLEQLHQFLNDDPADPFNLYALAIEYQKHDLREALRYFEQLVREHENYLPVYYTLGKLYVTTGQTELAMKVFEKGISKAREQNEPKTLRELRSFLDELMFE
jgi:tetratricopeptide (TPR) repeat protein